MPIIDAQRRLAETGRIRIGETVKGHKKDGTPYSRPVKRETFRFTSANKPAIDRLAALYGGTSREWEDSPSGKQWELFTEATTIEVLIPPERMAFSQFYEVWSGGGCKIRCDGQWDSVNEKPCACNPESRVCKPHTRLSVMLANLPGAGMWRLDTQGWNAATEIGGTFELAQMIAAATKKPLLPGTLRLDQRVSKKDGETFRFAVPVLDFDVDLTALARGDVAALGAGPGLTPVPDGDVELSLREAIAETENPPAAVPRRNAAEPVRPTGVAVRARGVVHEDDEDEGPAADGTPALEVADPEIMDRIRGARKLLGDDERSRANREWAAAGIPENAATWSQAIAERAWGIVRRILDDGDGGLEPDGPPRSPTGGGPIQVRPEDIEAPKPTPAKMRQMFALLSELGISGDEAQHDRVWEILKLPGASFTTLNRAQVNQVIDQLKLDKETKVLAERAAAGDPRTPEGDFYDAEGF